MHIIDEENLFHFRNNCFIEEILKIIVLAYFYISYNEQKIIFWDFH